MLNLQLASAYVDLAWNKTKYDTDMKVIQQGLTNLARPVIVSLVLRDRGLNAAVQRLKALRQAASTPITISFSANTSQLTAASSMLRQQMAGMQRRSFGTIPIRADLRPWRVAMRSVAMDLYKVRNFANIPLTMGGFAAAHSNLNLLIQHLQAAQGAARLTTGVRTGRGGGGYGGGGFLSGLTMGAGLPYASSPAMMAGQMVGGGARAGIGGSVATAMDLQTEMAEIRRLTGANADQAQAFKKQLFGISTSQAGVSMQDLLDISKTGARAGVADRSGMGGLATFTKDLAMVKNAVTDIPTEELADRMVRVLNVFELGTDRVAGFGSALTALDNISTASASDILDITTRLDGTGRAIGLTLPQVAAFASVLKDVGISNEVAGTSFSQIFRRIASDTDGFAEQIGVSSSKLADAFRRDPMEALGMVITKFNSLKDTIEGQKFLVELGFEGQRTAGSLQQLATKFDDVAKRAKIASDETGSLNALVQANELKSGTAEASLQKLKNAFTELGDAIGAKLLGPLTDTVNGLTGLTKAITEGNGPLLKRAAILGMANVASVATGGISPMPGGMRDQMQGELSQMFYDILYGTKAAEAAKPIAGMGGPAANALKALPAKNENPPPAGKINVPEVQAAGEAWWGNLTARAGKRVDMFKAAIGPNVGMLQRNAAALVPAIAANRPDPKLLAAAMADVGNRQKQFMDDFAKRGVMPAQRAEFMKRVGQDPTEEDRKRRPNFASALDIANERIKDFDAQRKGIQGAMPTLKQNSTLGMSGIDLGNRIQQNINEAANNKKEELGKLTDIKGLLVNIDKSLVNAARQAAAAILGK